MSTGFAHHHRCVGRTRAPGGSPPLPLETANRTRPRHRPWRYSTRLRCGQAAGPGAQGQQAGGHPHSLPRLVFTPMSEQARCSGCGRESPEGSENVSVRLDSQSHLDRFSCT
jgi:hypothetical protein